MQYDNLPYDGEAFDGAKMALYLGDMLAVILRDNIPGLVFADHWDLPGGGREDGESAPDCARRECREELGINVPETAFMWGNKYREASEVKWFYAVQMPADVASQVVLGNEGQRWTLMREADFLAHPKAVPAFQERLKDWIYIRDFYRKYNSLK